MSTQLRVRQVVAASTAGRSDAALRVDLAAMIHALCRNRIANLVCVSLCETCLCCRSLCPVCHGDNAFTRRHQRRLVFQQDC